MRKVLACLLLAFALLPAHAAQSVVDAYPQAKSFFPEADRFGELEGEPRAAPAYLGGTLLGWVFLTNDVVRIPAYSGKPINSLVGFDIRGRIRGIAIVEHQEPILAVGISEQRLKAFADHGRVGEPLRRDGGDADEVCAELGAAEVDVDAVAARGAEAVARSSLYRSGYELLFAPLLPAEKRASKALVDVGVTRLGDVLGALFVRLTLLAPATHAICRGARHSASPPHAPCASTSTVAAPATRTRRTAVIQYDRPSAYSAPALVVYPGSNSTSPPGASAAACARPRASPSAARASPCPRRCGRRSKTAR